MNEIKLELTDIYTVINNTVLNDNDRSVLTMLYKPIIGNDAISLYYSLWADLDKNNIMSAEYNLNHLVAACQCSLEEIDNAKDHLEAVGLIRTYVKEKNTDNYVFELYSPLFPKDFFDNILLNSILFNNLGKINYKKVVTYFSGIKIDLNDYQEITKPFNKVYTSVTAPHQITKLIKGRKEKAPSINSDFDFEILVATLPNKKMLNNNLKNLIKNLSYIYNLSAIELEPMLHDSIINNKVDEKKFRLKCRKYYQFENNGNIPHISLSKITTVSEPLTDDSSRSKMIYVFENTLPYKFLKAKYKGGKPTPKDLELIEGLIIEQKLAPSVVNVLIDYVLKINDNKLTKKYVEAIASQWKITGVKTAREAMELAESSQKKRKTYKTKNQKETETPAWFDKNIKKEETTKEEKEELEKLLKEFV